MRSMRIAPAMVLVAVGLSAGACGSKEPTAPAISLSSGEVFILAAELGDVMNGVTLLSVRPNAGRLFSVVPGLRFSPAATPINQTVTCPSGGNAVASGSYSSSTTTATLDVTFAYNGCKTAHYTTGGSVRVAGNATITQTTASLQAIFGGTLTVTHADGRSGSCKIDFTINESVSQTSSLTYTVSGTACGVNVSGTY